MDPVTKILIARERARFILGVPTMLVALLVMRKAGTVTPVSAILAMGLAGLVALVALASFLRIRPGGIAGGTIEKEIAEDHWNYGRWAVGTALGDCR